jgi:DNA-binding transcriptional MerR regulator
VGSGRRQRYPKEAFAVFARIKGENMKKRGRPRKDAVEGAKRAPRRSQRVARGRGRRAAAGGSDGQSGLLSLSEIGRRTGISYPTLVNYTKKHLARIPHSGAGRKRRYPPEAVEVFRELRASSRPGRPRKSAAAPGSRPAAAPADRALASRVRALERSQKRLSRQIDAVLALLRRPLEITIGRG